MTILKTFTIPKVVDGKESDQLLGKAMIEAWRKDGIFQISRDEHQEEITTQAMKASENFFRMPVEDKKGFVSPDTYSGYIASGEEVTAGEQDFSEIFTLCKDINESDPRYKEKWPCHGPVPWPSQEYRTAMTSFTTMLGQFGDEILKLVALGLDLPINSLFDLAKDGWHHMRVLKFIPGTSEKSRGIGAHTDYGLLVIANQNDVQGLYIRPPVEGEIRKKNWIEGQSSAGMYENEEPWTLVPAVAQVFTCFPGDILQLITNDFLLSTPHKVKLVEKERYALAYFHEPSFETSIGPLVTGSKDLPLHYGTHFTNMFMRCYPERITTKTIEEDERLEILSSQREKSLQQQMYRHGTPN